MTPPEDILKQQEKAKQLYNLHRSKNLLVLPNIWDCLGAMLLESLGYPAIATASASVAFTNGYDDGENIPFDEVMIILKRISSSVNVPVTADIESGYAESEIQLKKNIQQLLETGVVGINIEDSDKETNSVLPVETQCKRIKFIKQVSEEMGISLFINARTDIYIYGKDFATQESKLEETIKRGAAYKSAGADCFFPLAVRKEAEIKTIIEQLQMPVNILLLPGVPQLDVLQEMGVARVSLGPSFLKIAIQSMKQLAVKLQNLDGLSEIVENEITTDYLSNLINKKY
jgi:2-methylisocitrate lyase-like PEP mutase family enzyme